MKAKKLLVLGLCMALIATISITATLAYFTDTEAVTNTFTVGHVDIELDETPVNTDGKKVDGACVTENKYKLYPAKLYDKDPHIHVATDSEKCWVYVKVENGIADIESKTREADAEKGITAYKTIIDQMIANGWSLVAGETNIYQFATVCNPGQQVPTFAEFEIDSSVTAAKLAEYADAKIVLTGYAIQAEGFDSAAAAWEANGGVGNFQVWPTPTPAAEETPTPDDSTTTE